MQRVANFCPVCGAPTAEQSRNGRNRPVCTACGHIVYFDPKVAVVVFILRGDQLLLIQRAMDPGKGKWALPAGFVDHDEAPRNAAAREVLEETGYTATIDQLLDVFPKRDHGLADIIIAFSGSITGGDLSAGDDAASAGWFTKATVPELVFYPSITLVTRWQNGGL